MKFIHLSDLHVGKRWNGFSLLEDQKDIFGKILKIIDGEKPDAVIIAGDVYDKPMPSAEAVEVFDDFLADLAVRRMRVFVISGNHDSPERIAFGGRIMDASGIHLSPVYDGNVKSVVLSDEYGEVCVYMLPFVKPANVRAYADEQNAGGISTYEDALRYAVDNLKVDESRRNVLITHQYITGAVNAGSEERSVGGTDNISAAVFKQFDYVALGHIHGAQDVGEHRIRYCGTPLKYSFSEKDQQKSVTVAELGAKGDLNIRTVPLIPLHEVREVCGKYAELIKNPVTYDYVRVVLTDESSVLNAYANLKKIYVNLMEKDYANRSRQLKEVFEGTAVEEKSQTEICEEFYQKQNGEPMSSEQREYITSLIEEIWGEE